MQKISIINASKRFLSGQNFTVNHTFENCEGFLLYAAAGKGKVKLNGAVQTFSEGNILLCTGGDKLSYRFSAKAENVLYFIHFKTCSSSPLTETFGITKGVHRIYGTKEVERSFENLIKQFIIKPPMFEERLCALFYDLLYKVSLAHNKRTLVKELINKLAQEIHENFLREDIPVLEYAARAGLSKDRFSVIFKEHFGYPPYKYQIMLKIEEATFLLRHTDLTVGEIAGLLGYSDPLYFSSAYKKQTGIAPSEIRKQK